MLKLFFLVCVIGLSYSSDCTSKDVYLQKLQSAITKCAVFENFAGYPVTSNKTKLCDSQCKSEVEDLVTKCNEAGIDIDTNGAQLVSHTISRVCDENWEFECTDSDALVPELRSTASNCGIFVAGTAAASTDRLKLCGTKCRNQATELKRKCLETDVGTASIQMVTDLVETQCQRNYKPLDPETEFQCTDKDVYIKKMQFVITKCAIFQNDWGFPATLDKAKMCDSQCKTEADDLLNKCKDQTDINYSGAEMISDFISSVCDPNWEFLCTNSFVYNQRMRSVFGDTCGILEEEEEKSYVFSSKNKLCSSECKEQAGDLLAKCKTANIGGTGKQILVDIITRECEGWEFQCTDKDAYQNELRSVLGNCGISEGDDRQVITEKNKLCTPACKQQADDLLDKCTRADIGGNFKNQIVDTINQECASDAASSRTANNEDDTKTPQPLENTSSARAPFVSFVAGLSVFSYLWAQG